MSIFTGSAVALVTPFLENGDVDYAKLKELVEFHVAHKTDAIVICGTTGEASTLSHEEHLECVKKCVEFADHRIKVIAGTGSNCTATAIYLSTEAESYGVDGLLVVTPYYNKATQKGLIAHFTAVANSVNVPIILYNVPSRTGCNIQPETAVYLAQNVENIVGIKESSGNISQVVKLASLANGCIDIYSGNDDQVLPILSLGGKGVISVWSHVAPKKVHDMVYAYLNGDTATATKLQLEAIAVIGALFCEVNPIPVKAAMNMLGYKAGPVRAPLTELSDAHKELLEKALKDYGVL